MAGFWICLEFWICQCYTGFCRKRPIIHVWQSFENSPDYHCARAWIYKGCEYDNVSFTLKIHGILNVLSYAKVLNLSGVQICYSYKGFWIKYFMVYIWQGSEYPLISKYAKVVDILAFWICRGLLRKSYIIYAWQDSKYFSCSEYGRVLNMPGLNKALNKTLHYRYLIEFWIRL